MEKNFYSDNVEKLVPGIERQDEKREFDKMPSPEYQLKTEELWFRANHK